MTTLYILVGFATLALLRSIRAVNRYRMQVDALERQVERIERHVDALEKYTEKRVDMIETKFHNLLNE